MFSDRYIKYFLLVFNTKVSSVDKTDGGLVRTFYSLMVLTSRLEVSARRLAASASPT